MKSENGTPTDIPIIQSILFSQFPEICSGLSTRRGGISPHPFDLNLSFSVGDRDENVQENRKRFFGAFSIPIGQLAIPRQIHSDKVRLTVKSGLYPDTDALITSTPGIFLVVSIADCLPIFLYDRVGSVIAAVHAGWRGTHSKIVLKALDLMRRSCGTNPGDVFAFIGQGAGVCCYEVGDDVAHKFEQKYFCEFSEKKIHLDMKSVNRDMLIQSGIPQNQIEVSDECTICHPEWFHSYRREGRQSGRMMGVIGIRR